MKHWTEPYIGRPYGNGLDCAQLVFDARCEVFGAVPERLRELERAHTQLGRARQMESLVHDLGTITEAPQEGDAVLMLCRGRPSHIGIYATPGGVPSVLHAMKNAGQVVLHRIADLPRLLLSVEGYYKWPT
jgi:hypothetical protein